ncbi:E3 ubiquitin-protein ligase At4g11680-like [Impatiens glandulifera]|uniref:E3 ubiquitin-protein ligase At4g11680-like n=1 Tax=Impatiens glandulifera TaxID=253017 RepID=UPI001FB14E39|nr:E3 ubiquitin-protein ligase At4g11680-like [Impatiens glandulifera]
MSTSTTSPGSAPNDTVVVDVTPFLNTGEVGQGRQIIPWQTLTDAARFIQRGSNRRMLRNPSMIVREAAAEQLEERQSDWAYSKPVVFLDLLWNVSFVAVAAGVLLLSRDESPSMQLTLWIIGYSLQCVIHIICVYVEYRRRRRRQQYGEVLNSNTSETFSQYVSLAHLNDDGTSGMVKHLESANTLFSFIWWFIGFYWLSKDGQTLSNESPQLYWLSIVFLAFDVFFVLFCVALACVVGVAVCCCLPCIIAILYAVADQEGASREDIEQLTKYKFRRINDSEKKVQGGIGSQIAGVMTECGTDMPIEHEILQEDVDCCICLCTYDDGDELRELPCYHHFHCGCIDKWLHMNATCPLCKFNISKNDANNLRDEV